MNTPEDSEFRRVVLESVSLSAVTSELPAAIGRSQPKYGGKLALELKT